MNSSKSSPKHGDKASFKIVTPFELFYQLTYMSAMASAGVSRSKLFEIASVCASPASEYFVAINTLVDEFRYDYPEACRTVGAKAKSENMKTFLLRLADALRSGEPMAEFMAREAEAQGEEYQNFYERNLEGLKQWSNAFSSITISVALIVIIQVISAMLYSMNRASMLGLIMTGLTMDCFGTWIIWRSAPHEVMMMPARHGSAEQQRALKIFRMAGPIGLAICSILYILGVATGWIIIGIGVFLLPIGVATLIADKKTVKKDTEFSTFLRSVGGMATSSGTTLKQALTRIDLSSFPNLEPDIERLSTRLQALVEPDICWNKFGSESGSKLISEVIGIFYSAIKIGGEPERVGYLCSLFATKTVQLRAKRRLIGSTFAALTTVMQTVVAGIMVFVVSIVHNFFIMVQTLMPQSSAAAEGQSSMNMSLISLSYADIQFLSMITLMMIVTLATVGSAAITFSDGGSKLKVSFYLALSMFVSGACFLLVPHIVDGILKV